MKKILFIALILVAAVLFGAPFFTGKIAEKEAKNALQAFNQKATYGTQELLSYDRGFSSSTAKLRYTAPSFIDKKGEMVVDYNCNVAHQLSGVNYQCKLDPAGQYGEYVKEHLGGKDPLTFGMTASATGSVNYQIDLESFTATPQDGSNLDVKEASISVDTDKDFSRLKYDANFDGLTVNDKNGSMNVGEVTIESDSEKLAGWLYIGDAKIEINDIKVNSDKENFKLNDLVVDIEQKESGDKVDTEMLLSVDAIETDKEEVGTIEDIKFAFDWLNIDKAALIAYIEAVQEMQASALNAFANGDTKAYEKEMQSKAMSLVPVLEKLLSKDMELNLQLNGKVFDEENSVSAKLKLMDSLTMADSMMFAFAPKEALKKVEVKISNSINESLVSKAPFLAMVESSPLFNKKRDNYKMELSLGEKIKLNGEKMTIEELQGMFLSAALQ